MSQQGEARADAGNVKDFWNEAADPERPLTSTARQTP
jgi:hypothetical protein